MRDDKTGAGDKQNTRVVIVDNDASVRNSVKRLLDLHGLDVIIFSSAKELLAQPDHACQCYLLDIDLDDGSGIDLYRHLQAIGRGAPVVYMTGSDDEDTKAGAAKTGYIGYLTKPFTAAALFRALGDCAKASSPAGD